MEICGTCGVWAPRSGAACSWCGQPRASRRVTAPTAGPVCVAVRLSYVCRGCGLLSPIDAIDTRGTLRCVRPNCGREQRFERERWAEILAEAHAVGDLVGPSEEGRTAGPWSIASDNPYRDARRRGPVMRIDGEGDLKGRLPAGLVAELAPGHPVPLGGGRPLQLSADGDVLEARGQGEVQRFELPAGARQLYPRLLGALADDLVKERSAKTLTFTEGEALTCSSCAGPLPVDGTERLVRCAFCGATTHIPSPVLHRFQDDPVPDSWWLVFGGASPERERLERGQLEPLGIDEAPTQPSPPLRRALVVGPAVVLPALALLIAGLLWRLPQLVRTLGG